MEALKLYNIRFTGLKNGFHDFDYEIKGDFFKAFEGSLIQEADLKVALTLERKTNGLDLHFKTTGFLTLPCDRCLQAVNVPVSDESELLVKFSANPAESTESIWYLPTTAWEINVGQYLYETLNLLMPLRVSCEVGESGHCQSDFESLMQKYDGSSADSGESSDVDPRWEKLKNLKLN